MSWSSNQNIDVMPWLLEEESPGVRYLCLRDLHELPDDDPVLEQAKLKAHTDGPIHEILANMHPDGYWVSPGSGYNPKYRSSVWSLIMLAQLGATPEIDDRIDVAIAYLLEQTLNPDGQLSIYGTPSSTVDCLQGNLCRTLLDLGCKDPRLDLAFEWMARSVTGEGIAPASDRKAPLRYYAGKCGPNFCCGANDKLPCAWGATKVMLAFSKLPKERYTPLVEAAIQRGVDFLLSVDPAEATYPHGYAPKPSGNWWKFGFPVFYITDILQIAEALAELGYGDDPRLVNTQILIQQKGGDRYRWLQEYSYTGKTWIDFGDKKQPNKWVTLRALKALKKLNAIQ